MTFDEAIQTLDGLMLGDGCLYRHKGGAYFVMTLSKSLASHNSDPIEQERLRRLSLPDHTKWEQWIIDNAFSVLGVPVSAGCPMIEARTYKERPHPCAKLLTRESSLLTDFYDEWHRGGEWVQNRQGSWYLHGRAKVLPARIMNASTLPTWSLVHWFLGDGGSSLCQWDGHSSRVRISFATCCFTEKEVYHLTSMLNNMGIVTIKPRQDRRVKKGSGLSIWLSSTAKNTDHFIDLVEPGITEIFGDSQSPSYKDKIKRR